MFLYESKMMLGDGLKVWLELIYYIKNLTIKKSFDHLGDFKCDFFQTCWKNELNLDKLRAASCKSQQEKITQDLRLVICDQKYTLMYK